MKDLPRRTAKSERTRADILDAARALFAQLGYERTTVREIAAQAGADPALVIRYFGSKEGLFARAAEFDLQLPDLTKTPPSQLGDTLIRHFLDLWEGPSSKGSLAVLLRAAATNEDAAAKAREIFAGQVMPMLGSVTDRREASTRAGLVSSHLLGIALCRYILNVPPVVAMSPEQITKYVGPVLQRYLTSPSLRERKVGSVSLHAGSGGIIHDPID
jgi:AcrR family transcriptional regulator